VRFAGARADAPAILAQCDVQLMTSCREGFPNVVLEGMVLGVPVVSTDYSDIRHILPRARQVS
jgi:glycosyltransferase involved in cell wall biosynthesis